MCTFYIYLRFINSTVYKLVVNKNKYPFVETCMSNNSSTVKPNNIKNKNKS